MTDLRVKKERKPPKRFLVEFSSHRSQVEVKRKVLDIDKAQNTVKIHYKRYGAEFDEWSSFVELLDQFQFVWRSCVHRVMIPLKTDTSHFTIASM